MRRWLLWMLVVVIVLVVFGTQRRSVACKDSVPSMVMKDGTRSEFSAAAARSPNPITRRPYCPAK